MQPSIRYKYAIYRLFNVLCVAIKICCRLKNSREFRIIQVHKWLCVALVAISVLLLFSGGIIIEDKDERKSFKQDAKDLYSYMSDISKDEVKDLQEDLDYMDLDISAKKFVKQIRKVAGAAKDGAVSPSEFATVGPMLLSLLKDGNSFGTGWVGDILSDDVVNAIKNAKVAIWMGILLFYLTLVTGLVVIAAHIFNYKLSGISITVLQLVWIIILGVIVHKINVKAHSNDDLVRITAAPIWAFIFALIAMLLWMLRKQILSMIIHRFNGNMRPAQKFVANTNSCPSCGNYLGPNAVFCTNCGTKFTPIATAPEIPNDTSISSYNAPQTIKQAIESNQETPLFCINCGAKLPENSEFCNQCGTKIQKL